MERFPEPAPSPEAAKVPVDIIEASTKWVADADAEIMKMQGYIERFKKRVAEKRPSESSQILFMEAMEGQIASMEAALAVMIESRDMMSEVPAILAGTDAEEKGNHLMAA